MTTEPLLSPADLHKIGACHADRRLRDTRAAGWPDDQPRRLREWAALPRADGDGLSAPLGDIAWAMMRLDAHRWSRAMAAVLEAILPADADLRSLAVISMLRSDDWSEAENVVGAAWAAAVLTAWEGATAAAWEAATAAARATVRAAWAVEGAKVRAAWAAIAAERARPDLDITTIMLDSWEK